MARRDRKGALLKMVSLHPVAAIAVQADTELFTALVELRPLDVGRVVLH